MKMRQGCLVCVFMICTIFNITLGSKYMGKTSVKPMDPLSNLGDITINLVTTLAQAEDEQVDIYGMANLITAISEAVSTIDHPIVSK